MKKIKAQNKFENYQTIEMPIEALVPASYYDVIPDEDKIRPDLEKGILQYPLLCYQTDQKYWKENHLRLYHSGNPQLPEQAPETEVDVTKQGRPYREKKIHVVWSGRQRFQILKEQGYTHVDVIVESVFHKMVDAAQKFRKFNKENV